MPVNPTFPGVYIQEAPSSVRTITGVATSITAFIGSANRGPTNQSVVINSFADFERTFGGLWLRSALGYAVQDFYLNGGSQAIIVRLFNPDQNANQPVNTETKFNVAGLTLQAASEGAWGNSLVVSVDHYVSTNTQDGHYDPAATEVFNLTAQEKVNGQVVRTEQFLNLTVANGPRRIDKVLAAGSQLVYWDSANALSTQASVTAAATAAAGAMAPVITKQNALIDALQAKPPVPATIATAQQDLKNAMATLNTQTITTTATNGQVLDAPSFNPPDGLANKQGLYALENADLFNILCVPPYNDLVTDGGSGDVDTALLGTLAGYCAMRRAILIVDPPSGWATTNEAVTGLPALTLAIGSDLSTNTALFFPRLLKADILQKNQIETFVPCGSVAGIFARTDTQRGVWKAPAGLDASIAGLAGVTVPLTNDENGQLNPLGINCLRIFPAAGGVVWGARTMAGDDRLASQWKYIPVRRTALYIEESLYRGTQWVVFEPNDEPLWAQIRLNVGAFMHNLFVKGAFQGSTPKDAYFVKCDSETNPQNDIDLGIVNIIVGFAPLKPAEFVIITLQQIAGQIQV